MKKVLSIMSGLSVMAFLTLSFTVPLTTKVENEGAITSKSFTGMAPRMFHSHQQHAGVVDPLYWTKKSQSISLDGTTIVVTNNWYANVRIDYIAVGDANTDYATGTFPINPGDNESVTAPNSGSVTVYFGVTVLGASANGNTPTLEFDTFDGVSYSTTITGSGEISFSNVALRGSVSNPLIIDTE